MARQFRTGLIIEGDASGGIRAIRATDDQLKQLNSGFQKGGRQAQRYGRQVTQTDRTLAAIRRTALTAATALASVFAVRTLQGQIDFADELQKTRDRIGASTEALSQYNYVAQMSGVQLNTLTTAWQRQTRRINEAARGTGVASEALQRLGLDARVLASMRPEDQFEAIAEAMEGIADEGERVALAQKIWDSGGVQLLQMTNQGAAAMREMRQEADRLGLTITNETADNMAAFNDEISRVKFALQGLTATMLAEVVPSLTDGVTRVNDWIEALGGAEAVLGHVRTGVSVLAALMAGRAAQSLATYVAAKYAAVAASVALNGTLITLRTTLLTLMGPVGLVVAGASLLFTFREELGLVGREADQVRIDVQGLAGAFRDLTAAQQENKRASLLNDLIEMRLEAGRLGTELASVSQKVRQSGQLTPEGGALPVATPEDIARGRELRAELAGLMTNIDDSTQLLDEYDQIMADLGETTLATTTNTRTLADSQRESQRAADEHARALQRLQDRLFPLEAQQRQYKSEQETLTLAWARGEIGVVRYMQAMTRLREEMQATGEVWDAYPSLFGGDTEAEDQGTFWERWLEGAQSAMTDFDQLAANTFDRFTAASGQAFESMIFDATSAEDAFRGLADTMLRSVVRALGEMMAQELVYQAVLATRGTVAGSVAAQEIAATAASTSASLSATATTTAAQTSAAATTTAAWTPAAIAASIGSFGAAAAIGLAAVVAAMAFSGGFRKGGYTGNGGVDEVAGVVHGREYVFDAASTARIGVKNLEAMRSGRAMPGNVVPIPTGGAARAAPRVTVNLIEDAERAGSVEQESMDDEEIINVFVANIASGGDAARAIEATYGVNRQGR